MNIKKHNKKLPAQVPAAALRAPRVLTRPNCGMLVTLGLSVTLASLVPGATVEKGFCVVNRKGVPELERESCEAGCSAEQCGECRCRACDVCKCGAVDPFTGMMFSDFVCGHKEMMEHRFYLGEAGGSLAAALLFAT